MNGTTMYAVDMRGRALAELRLAEGADVVDALIFAYKTVPGAHDVTARPASMPPPIEESTRRIEVAAREAAGLPPAAAPKAGETIQAAPGSLEESGLRIDAALADWDDRPGVAPPPRPTLPVLAVPKQEGRSSPRGPVSGSDDFRLRLAETQRTLAEVKVSVERLAEKKRSAPAPAPTKPTGKPVELREVPAVETPTLEESRTRIDKALAAL